MGPENVKVSHSVNERKKERENEKARKNDPTNPINLSRVGLSDLHGALRSR